MHRIARRAVVSIPALSVALFALAILTPGCDSGDPADPNEVDAIVSVRGNLLSYNPESVTIRVGDTVRWTWDDSGHSVTSVTMVGGAPSCTADGVHTSGILNFGALYDHTFTTAGTYGYACMAPGHCGDFESGVVVVQ